MKRTVLNFCLIMHVFCVQAWAISDPNVDATPIAPVMRLEEYLRLRDPFKRITFKSSFEDELKIPPLERFSSEDYKLVGVITGPKKHKALITSPVGKIHIVTENTKIGLRKGFIKKITAQNIIIEERVLNLLGQEEKINTVLEFKDKNKDGAWNN